jgi:hypothetical protein
MNKNYVKEYKGYKVPEGATHYNEGNMLWPECFINKNTGEVYKLDEPRIWVLSERVMPTTAIELPEEQSQEWVDGLPSVGCECLTLHKGDLVECLYVGKGIGEEYIYQVTSGCHRGEIDRLIGSPRFRPLKTQEQKDREAFASECAKYIDMPFDEGGQVVLTGVFYKLLDAGFKAPEGE